MLWVTHSLKLTETHTQLDGITVLQATVVTFLTAIVILEFILQIVPVGPCIITKSTAITVTVTVKE